MLDPETKGERARDILDSEVYQEAVHGARQRIQNEWAVATSEAERESHWHRLRAIDAVTRELTAIRDNGVKLRTDRIRKEVRSA